MKLCLIVYYSRSGVTAQVAHALAQRCNADIEQLQDLRPRAGAAGYLRSAWEALRGIPGAIAPVQRRAADYPFIVLGTPVWGGHMASPMRSYILQQREHFRRVGLFCTMGGSGGPHVISAMADLCNKLPEASLCLRQQEVQAGRMMAALDDFATQLGLGPEQVQPAATPQGVGTPAHPG